ncbi:hypothetical protein [Paraburkholderia terrae]|uniref:hypothetical protein n=1 Tax=Paraburkholderia terrae TaxID=311230 RepID=UPI000694A5A7|nr:hypothetical protein [Paraburkholderia terrae]
MKNNYPGRITRPGRHAHVRSNTGVSSWHGRHPLTLLCGALLAASSVHVAHAQVADTLGEQEQRRRAQEQAIERERTLQAPKVALQAAARPEIDDGKLPVETPCFRLDELTLEVPPGLSETVEAAGARALSPNPLFPGELTFARDYLQRYIGQCVGREGLNLIVHRVMAQIIGKG